MLSINRTWAGHLTVVAGLLLFSGAASAQKPRFPILKLEETKGDQRALAERMLKETRAGLGGPWNIMLRSPNMAEGMVNLYNYFRWKTVLPPSLMEFGVLITAREWSSQYEWYVHYPLAVKAGVSPESLADLRAGKRPGGMKPEEAVAYDFSIELLRKHFVSDAMFQKAKTVLGEQAVVDLTALLGTYVAIGGLLNVSETEVPVTSGPDFLPPETR